MAYGNAGDIASGAMSGAAAGSAFGPYGAAAGGVIGAGMGLFGGGKKTVGYSKGDLDAIASQGYSDARANYGTYSGLIDDYLRQAQNISSTTFGNYFGPSTITKMAAMGLNPNGGATNAALAQQSMLMQGDMLDKGFGARQSALGMLNNSEMSIRGSQLGGGFQNFGVPQSPSWMTAMGQIGGSALGYKMATGNSLFGNMSNPFGGGAGQNAGYATPSMFGSPGGSGFGGSSNKLNLSYGAR